MPLQSAILLGTLLQAVVKFLQTTCVACGKALSIRTPEPLNKTCGDPVDNPIGVSPSESDSTADSDSSSGGRARERTGAVPGADEGGTGVGGWAHVRSRFSNREIVEALAQLVDWVSDLNYAVAQASPHAPVAADVLQCVRDTLYNTTAVAGSTLVARCEHSEAEKLGESPSWMLVLLFACACAGMLTDLTKGVLLAMRHSAEKEADANKKAWEADTTRAAKHQHMGARAASVGLLLEDLPQMVLVLLNEVVYRGGSFDRDAVLTLAAAVVNLCVKSVLVRANVKRTADPNELTVLDLEDGNNPERVLVK